jgi:LPXTG-motif cell wall-anchored protein
VLFLSRGYAQDTFDEKHIEVSLRMIGHQVLLSSNDSTSRVLPIFNNNNQYRIEFESEFAFNPEELVSIVDTVVSKTNLANSYIVEVQKCDTGEIVYSFKMDDLEQSDIIPCKARMQPKSCYILLFTLGQTTGTNAALLPMPTDSPQESKTGSNMVYYGFIIALLVLIGVVFYLLWRRKKSLTNDPNLISLGEYHFDKRNTELLINHRKIELTSKEADLLLLLYNMVNTTVEREVILNKVWGDQGDYVGRTLDVFISKLRKKLEADSSVKIANIRGVGYKLVIDV